VSRGMRQRGARMRASAPCLMACAGMTTDARLHTNGSCQANRVRGWVWPAMSRCTGRSKFWREKLSARGGARINRRDRCRGTVSEQALSRDASKTRSPGTAPPTTFGSLRQWAATGSFGAGCNRQIMAHRACDCSSSWPPPMATKAPPSQTSIECARRSWGRL